MTPEEYENALDALGDPATPLKFKGAIMQRVKDFESQPKDKTTEAAYGMGSQKVPAANRDETTAAAYGMGSQTIPEQRPEEQRRLPAGFVRGKPGQTQDTKLASASKIAELYAPPEFATSRSGPYLHSSTANFNQTGPDDTSEQAPGAVNDLLEAAKNTLTAEHWQEPSEEQFLRAHPEAAQLQGPQRIAAYQEFSDAEYKNAYGKAVAEGRPIVRVAYATPAAGKNDGWFESVTRTLKRPALEAVDALGGMVRQIPGYGTAAEAAARGVGAETSEQQQAIHEQHPVGGLLGESTLLSSGHAYNKILGATAPKPAETVLGRAAQSGAHGALAAGGITASESALKNEPVPRAEALPRLLPSMAVGGIIGSALSPVSDLLGAPGKALRRDNPDVVKVEGADIGKPAFIGGVKPNEGFGKVLAEADKGDLTLPRQARVGKVEEARVGPIKERFYGTPEGQTKVPTESIAKAAGEELEGLHQSTGEPTPGENIKRDVKKLEGYQKEFREVVPVSELHERFRAVTDHAGNPLPGKDQEAAYLRGKIAESYDTQTVSGNDPNLQMNESDPIRRARLQREADAKGLFRMDEEMAARQGFSPQGEPVTRERDVRGEVPLTGRQGIPISSNRDVARKPLNERPATQGPAYPPEAPRSVYDDPDVLRSTPDGRPIPDQGATNPGGKNPALETTAPAPHEAANEPADAIDMREHLKDYPILRKFIEATPKTDVAELSPLKNAEDLDKFIDGLERIKKDWTAKGMKTEPFEGYNGLLKSALEARDKFVGTGGDIPAGPGGYSKFKQTEAARREAEDAFFRLKDQSKLHLRGWPVPFIPIPSSGMGARLRLDYPLQELSRVTGGGRPGALGGVDPDLERRKNELMLQFRRNSPLGGGL